MEAKRIFAFLPLTRAMIDALEATGVDTSGMEPHGPLPVTLKSKLIEKGQWSWHVPVAVKCSAPFTKLPLATVIVEQITKFLDVKREGAAVSTGALNNPQDPDGRIR
jgi:hypothetical protein